MKRMPSFVPTSVIANANHLMLNFVVYSPKRLDCAGRMKLSSGHSKMTSTEHIGQVVESESFREIRFLKQCQFITSSKLSIIRFRSNRKRESVSGCIYIVRVCTKVVEIIPEIAVSGAVSLT